MEKVVGGKGDEEVWLVERKERYKGKGALVAWLQHTFEAVLAKQSGWVHYCLVVAYLAVVALLVQHCYYYYYHKVITFYSHAKLLESYLCVSRDTPSLCLLRDP